MKNFKHFILTFLSFVVMSGAAIQAAPSTTLTAESCGGYVLVINHSDCNQTIYCHEITTSNQVFNMGTIAPGGTLSVYPTASQARVWTEAADGEETSTMDVNCVNNYTLNTNHCDNSYTCEIDIVNNGCKTLQIYGSVNGAWVVVEHVAVGETEQYHPVPQETLIFAYSYDEVLGTITADCGKTYTVNDDDCEDECLIHLTNNACHDVKVYVKVASDWHYVGLIDKGESYAHASVNGAVYKFTYTDGTSLNNWTGWCGESYSITDQCAQNCTIYLKNEACDKVYVYIENGADWALIGSLNVGVTYSHNSHNGARYRFKYPNGTVISTWTGWCGESYSVTDSCVQECDVYFDNDACEDLHVYVEDGNDWNFIGTLDKGVKYRHTATQGATYRFKYADGTEVADWNAWCGETFVITDDCSSCDMYFTNNACNDIKVYQLNASDWAYIGSLEKGKTYKHATANGTTYKFMYEDGTVVATWTGWCGESFDITDECQTPCHVTIKNRTCGRIQILKNDDGVLVSKGYLDVGESKVLYVYAGTNFIMKKDDGTHAGSWTAQCDKIYTAHESCPTICHGYIKNEGCGPVSVYKVRSGYSNISVGVAQVGSSLQLEAEEGTKFIVKYSNGTQVAEWNLVCDSSFTFSDQCASPCDDVTVTAIKIYDQETDSELAGIGAITEGMVIDGDLLPDAYYITAEVSDASESVTLIVDGWLVCENYAPYTYPNAAHQGTDWDGGAGAHSVTVKTSSEADCYGDVCDEVTVNFTITEGTQTTPTCNLGLSVSQSDPACDGVITLSASVTGASDCCEGEVISSCGTLSTYGGYVIDVESVSGCADGNGIRLWGAGATETTFVTVDLGGVYTAGKEICVSMFMKHCLNTDATTASASIYTSTEQNDGFVSLSGAIFDDAEFTEFCFNLTSDTRFVRIVDNALCSFRVDAVSVSGSECAASSDVEYFWLNSNGDTIANSAAVAIAQTGDYMVAVKDCAGCLDIVEDITVGSLNATDCYETAAGGFIGLDNGETVIDVCIGDGVSDAFNVNLSGQIGEFSAWVVLDAFRNIIAIPSGSPFDFENSTHGAGLCIICHVSYNGSLGGFEIGLNANDVSGDISFSNEISVTKFTSGGPCGNSGVDPANSSRQMAEGRTLDLDIDVDITIYPNPATDVLFVNPAFGDTASPVKTEIFTIDGKLVQQAQVLSNQLNQIDISGLTSQQFYIVRVNGAEHGVHVERIYKSE